MISQVVKVSSDDSCLYFFNRYASNNWVFDSTIGNLADIPIKFDYPVHMILAANSDLLALNATASERINFLATEKKPDFRYKPDATNLYTYSIGYVFVRQPWRG